MPENSGQVWDKHWQALDQASPAFGFLSRLVRRGIFQPVVRYYLERFFPDEGIFVEMGCGTAESSALIAKRGRRLCGLDFSIVALRKAKALRSLPDLTCGDLFSLPFQDESLTGIWNLGVMEHFTRPNLESILLEFRRVLKPGGVAILFWPTEFNSSRWVLGPIEYVRTSITGTPFRFFPDEVSRLQSRSQAT
jgi:SAM-dependent methyltransferase